MRFIQTTQHNPIERVIYSMLKSAMASPIDYKRVALQNVCCSEVVQQYQDTSMLQTIY